MLSKKQKKACDLIVSDSFAGVTQMEVKDFSVNTEAHRSGWLTGRRGGVNRGVASKRKMKRGGGFAAVVGDWLQIILIISTPSRHIMLNKIGSAGNCRLFATSYPFIHSRHMYLSSFSALFRPFLPPPFLSIICWLFFLSFFFFWMSPCVLPLIVSADSARVTVCTDVIQIWEVFDWQWHAVTFNRASVIVAASCSQSGRARDGCFKAETLKVPSYAHFQMGIRWEN